MRHLISSNVLMVFVLGWAGSWAGPSALSQEVQKAPWNEAVSGPLPHWRQTALPALDPGRSLLPYRVARRTVQRVPTSGTIASPPEYSPTAGVLFRYSSGAWPQVVTDCVAALTGDPAHDERAYVVVSSVSQQNTASSQFAAAGADLAKVDFIIMPTDSIWLRDYGPHFIWQNAVRGVVDSHYYPTRPFDNFLPTLLADDYFMQPSYDIGLYYSGGNFQPGPNGSGFMTSLINLDNPASDGFDATFIAQLLNTYQGIETLHLMPQLPWSVDGTGHLDMWMYLVDDDTVMISEFIPGSNATAIQITNNAVPYMESLGFEVFRLPALNSGGVHYTYTNAFRVNDRIFTPSYATGGGSHVARDAQALAAWQAAAPDATIIPIDSYSIIPAAGAIHCIVMQVPRYESELPAAHVVSPDGGELLASGSSHDLYWGADDDEQVTAVELYYSVDGGATFPYLIADHEFNDGHYEWLVPNTPAAQAVVSVVAVDRQDQVGQGISQGPFQIAGVGQTVYDFSSGAGVDKWAWGSQTSGWAALNERLPAQLTTELSAADYARLAAPDASGGDSDTNRYVSPYPGAGYESTHVFEFIIDEPSAAILDLGITWEGYADDCTQAELYVWDAVAHRWCDGAGHYNQNRYLDNFAGNRDARLAGHIRQNLERFVAVDGLLTVLVYAERSSNRTFHDYIAVTLDIAAPADLNADGAVNAADLALLLGSWGPCPGCPADLDADGTVTAADLALLLGGWTG